jgi:hypothetical protein
MSFHRILLSVTVLVTMPLAPVSPQTCRDPGQAVRDAEKRLSNEIGQLLNQERANQLSGGTSDPQVRPKLEELLHQYNDQVVQPLIRLAQKDGDQGDFDSVAIGEKKMLDFWRSAALLGVDSLTPDLGTMAAIFQPIAVAYFNAGYRSCMTGGVRGPAALGQMFGAIREVELLQTDVDPAAIFGADYKTKIDRCVDESRKCSDLAKLLHAIGEMETLQAAYDRVSKEAWAQQASGEAGLQRFNEEVQADLDRYEQSHPFTHETAFVESDMKWRAANTCAGVIFGTETIAQMAEEDATIDDTELQYLKEQKSKLEEKCLGTIGVKSSLQANVGDLHAEVSSQEAMIELSFAADDTFEGYGSLPFQVHGTSPKCQSSGGVVAVWRVSGDVNEQRMHVSISAVRWGDITVIQTCNNGDNSSRTEPGRSAPPSPQTGGVFDFALDFPIPAKSDTRVIYGDTLTTTATIVSPSEPASLRGAH